MRTRVFSKNFETAYFILLPIFIVLLAAQLCGLMQPWSIKSELIHFMMAIVFLNSVHAIFSFVMLSAFPEFRAWLKDLCMSGRGITFFVITVAIIYCGCVRISAMSYANRIFVSYLMVGLAAVHNAAQVKGLSLMYNRKHAEKLSPDEIVRQKQVEKIERILFNSLLGFIFAEKFIRIVLKQKHAYTWGLTGLCIIAAVLIFANVFRYPQIKKSNKPWFLTNLVFVALSAVSAPANIIQRSLHGIEYGFLCTDISKRSSRKRTLGTALLIAALVLTFTVSVTYTVRVFPRPIWTSKYLWSTLLVVNFFAEFFHYYIDSLMFKFSDPLVRKHLKDIVLAEAV